MRSEPVLEQLSYEEKMLKTECPEQYYVSHILPHKLRLSLEYSQTRTFFSDLKIIFQTLGAATTGEQCSSSSCSASQQASNPISSKK